MSRYIPMFSTTNLWKVYKREKYITDFCIIKNLNYCFDQRTSIELHQIVSGSTTSLCTQIKSRLYYTSCTIKSYSSHRILHKRILKITITNNILLILHTKKNNLLMVSIYEKKRRINMDRYKHICDNESFILFMKVGGRRKNVKNIGKNLIYWKWTWNFISRQRQIRQLR